MRKRIAVLAALVLAVVCNLSVSFAIYEHQETASLLGKTIVVRNWIADDKMSAGASTNGGADVYCTVSATYYWNNPYTHEQGNFSNGSSYMTGASVGSGTMTGNKRIYNVTSDHYASYGGSSVSYDDLVTVAD